MSNWKESTLYKYYYSNNNLPSGWIDFFKRAEVKSEILNISREITKRCRANPDLVVYPDIHQVFRAFELTPLENIKLYISGQDPYHNGAAVGLAFSVKEGNKVNPSLVNIYKKLSLEYPEKVVERDGNLEHWAKQGVFLINAALTVEKGVANSHKTLWQKFYNILVKYIVENKEGIIYLLLGAYAHRIKDIVSKNDDTRIICTSHPSPLGANKKCGIYPSFTETTIFKDINEHLDTPINW